MKTKMESKKWGAQPSRLLFSASRLKPCLAIFPRRNLKSRSDEGSGATLEPARATRALPGILKTAEMSRVSGHRPDATAIVNGRLEYFSDQKMPKLASDIVMPDLDKGFWKSDKGMSKPDKGFLKSDKGMSESDKGLLKPDKGMLKPDKGISESDKRFWKLDKGLSELDKGFWKSVKGMSEPDKGFCNPDKGMSELEIVIKMIKNRQLARKRQKMGRSCKFYADFYKTGVAASRQRAASIVSSRNAAICRNESKSLALLIYYYGGKSGGGLAQSKTLCVRDDSWKTRSVLECASPLALCRVNQDSGATPEPARATRALPEIQISSSRGGEAHFKKSEIGNESETPHVVSYFQWQWSCFPA